MQDRPDAADLLDAIQEFLMKEVMPRVKSEDAIAYKTLVSWNMLGVIGRELREAEPFLNHELGRLANLLEESAGDLPDSYAEKKALARDWNRRLARKIRSEGLDATNREVLGHLKQTLQEKLQVANPRFSTGE